MKHTERFTDKAENYVRYRPHYPAEIIPFLQQTIGLMPHWIIADVGSGTGISSELFLKNGNYVYAIEPNDDMRQKAEHLLQNEKNFISIPATAEATTLADKSVDLIVAGQAFHWFDTALSKKEFQRIAKPNAFLLLMWNDRKLDSPFQQAYEQMLKEFALDYDEVTMSNFDERKIQMFFSPSEYNSKTFQNVQYFDREGLKGRLLSCSYAPPKNHPNYLPIMQKLDEIFNRFNINSQIEFAYHCHVYVGRIP